MLVLLITWLVSVFGVLIGASLYRGGKTNRLKGDPYESLLGASEGSKRSGNLSKTTTEIRPELSAWSAFDQFYLNNDTFLAALAEQQAEMGNFHLSAIVMDRLTDPILFIHARLSLANHLANVRDLYNAQQIIETTPVEPHQLSLLCKKADVICEALEVAATIETIDWSPVFIQHLEEILVLLAEQPLLVAQYCERVGRVLDQRDQLDRAVIWWKRAVTIGDQIDPNCDVQTREAFQKLVHRIGERLIREQKTGSVSFRWTMFHAHLRKDISILREAILKFPTLSTVDSKETDTLTQG
jgi:hypothetical protein